MSYINIYTHTYIYLYVINFLYQCICGKMKIMLGIEIMLNNSDTESDYTCFLSYEDSAFKSVYTVYVHLYSVCLS